MVRLIAGTTENDKIVGAGTGSRHLTAAARGEPVGMRRSRGLPPQAGIRENVNVS
jgi:hypothetical protein